MSAAVINPMDLRNEVVLTLTARGRRVLGAFGVLVALVLVLLGGRAVAGAPDDPIPVDTYTVQSGESLWTIAVAYTAPSEDVRDTVDELVVLNGLDDGGLRAGRQILVPAS